MCTCVPFNVWPDLLHTLMSSPISAALHASLPFFLMQFTFSTISCTLNVQFDRREGHTQSAFASGLLASSGTSIFESIYDSEAIMSCSSCHFYPLNVSLALLSVFTQSMILIRCYRFFFTHFSVNR